METENKESSNLSDSKWERMITPHGEVDVEVLPDGKRNYYPLKTEALKELPSKFRLAHQSEMLLFHSILMYIKKHHPNRQMPVTKKEFLKSGADPKIMQQLVEFDLLKECLVAVRDRTGKHTGARSCFYYTDQGRAFIRAKSDDPTYALTEYKDD